ncbi:hypothetical protein [Cytophaga aurantiaca]|uniref:hypothetical protein n=1 Tax=Cytophaga aurantiaca TaxID=29530 RepID=UPI0003738399|nr:hypothetical protein [Cytophaga aurantiaca]
MKQMLALVFLVACTSIFAQTLPDLSKIKLEKKGDYKSAEPTVKQAAAYLLTTPYKDKDSVRTSCVAFIIKWMEGTPDYTFIIDEPIMKLNKENPNLLGLCFASMAKYCLEEPAYAKDPKVVKLHTYKILLEYCDKPENNIPLTKQLKKLSDANKKGQLEKELF